MAITFRQCVPADGEWFTGLILDWHRREGRPADLGVVRRGVNQLLADSQIGHAWVIELGGFAIGYTVLTVSPPRGHFAPRAYVAALYHRAGTSGEGLGRRTEHFLADVCRWLRLPCHSFETAGEGKHATLLTRTGRGVSSGGIDRENRAVA